MRKFLVALVGRPNVGKSAIFNRLTGQRTAIVEDTPGVTRDRIYASCSWGKKNFSLIDTGGLEEADDELSTLVTEQTQLAVQEANLILFVMDARDGILPLDETILQQLYKSSKPVVLVANKVDGPAQENQLGEFYALGKHVHLISAEHGLGIGDLLDEVAQHVPDNTATTDDPRLKVALIGRPNVGKSSLLNRFIGEERTLVCDMPGTTRDAFDTPFSIGNQPALLIDTAGIRKKGKVKLALEKYCIIKALQSIERADICILVLDAQEGITDQDTKLAGYINGAGTACLVAINKWDLVGPDLSAKETNEYLAKVKHRLRFVSYAPLVLTSAQEGQGIKKILNLSLKIWAQANEKISTPRLNQLLKKIITKHPPASYKGKETKLFYVTQSGNCPPTFTLFVNQPAGLHFTYMRYLNNQFRDAFGFQGTPLKFITRRRQH